MKNISLTVPLWIVVFLLSIIAGLLLKISFEGKKQDSVFVESHYYEQDVEKPACISKDLKIKEADYCEAGESILLKYVVDSKNNCFALFLDRKTGELKDSVDESCSPQVLQDAERIFWEK